MTYDYSNKPEKLKSPALNKAYKEYYEKSDIPFGIIDVSFDYGFSVVFDSRADKDNLYGDLHNPLYLNYTKDFESVVHLDDYIKVNEDWYTEFSPIF